MPHKLSFDGIERRRKETKALLTDIEHVMDLLPESPIPRSCCVHLSQFHQFCAYEKTLLIKKPVAENPVAENSVAKIQT